MYELNIYLIIFSKLIIIIGDLIVDAKGYVMGLLSFLLIIPSILLLIAVVDMVSLDQSSNIMIKSDASFNILGDVERNIPIFTMQVFKQSAEEVVKTGDPIPNSRMVIRDRIESKIKNLTADYGNNTGVNVKCIIKSVDSSLNPFEVEINSSISVSKDNISYNKDICQNVSILGLNQPKGYPGQNDRYYRIPDPLPFIKCKKHGDIIVTEGRINYGSSLSNYLKKTGLKEASAYENASSPFYIKKCPYEPYTAHGNSKFSTLKNCIENGFYHESSDGACFLCRLEGRSVCSHYGFETFIRPAGCCNKTIEHAPCSVDHVIFNDKTYYGIYRGEAFQYYSNETDNFILFLDNGHRTKYGLQAIGNSNILVNN